MTPATGSAAYASETPGKGRMHTCLDQYYVLKAANALGGEVDLEGRRLLQPVQCQAEGLIRNSI